MCTTGCCGNGCRSPYVLPVGPKGDTGLTGSQGPTGAQGAQGQTGATGAPGSNVQQSVAKFAKDFSIVPSGASTTGNHTVTAAELSVAGMPFDEINVNTTTMTAASVTPTNPSYIISLYKSFGGAGNWKKVGESANGTLEDLTAGLSYMTFNPSGDLIISALSGTYRVIIIG